MMKATIFIKYESIEIIEAQSYIPEATRDTKGLHRLIIEARSHTRGLHDEARVERCTAFRTPTTPATSSTTRRESA